MIIRQNIGPYPAVGDLLEYRKCRNFFAPNFRQQRFFIVGGYNNSAGVELHATLLDPRAESPGDYFHRKGLPSTTPLFLYYYKRRSRCSQRKHSNSSENMQTKEIRFK